MIRICRALLFYLSHNQEPVYQPYSLSEESTWIDQNGEHAQRVAITNISNCLLWTHWLLRALLKKTWGDQSSVLLQLVC